MAHKVACNRKKCIKSANYFREREELSSLYTISSHSTSSIHSTDMITDTSRQSNYQNKSFVKEETYDGDTYRKSPLICTCNMKNGVHQNTCSYNRNCYNEKAHYLKNQFGGAPIEACEYVRQCCTKPCCNVHQYSTAKYCTNRKNLEECYWAKWKPNKCVQRRRACCECDCPKLREPRTQDKSVEVLREPVALETTSSNENATVKRSTNHAKVKSSTNEPYQKVQPPNNDFYQDVQPSPNDFYQKVQPSDNDSYQKVQPSDNDSYHKVQPSTKDFYQKVISEYNNHFVEPQTPHDNIQGEITRSNIPLLEPSVRFTSQDRILEFVPENDPDRKLYNELYEEYENVFMRNIEENEQRKSEYYQELYNDMYNENELLSRMPSDQTETTETMPVETESIAIESESTAIETESMPIETESIPIETESIPVETETDNTDDKTDSITVLHKAEDQKSEDGKVSEEEKEEEVMVVKEPKRKIMMSETKDVKIIESYVANNKSEPQENVSQPKIVKLPNFAIERLKGHTYPLKSVPKKQPQEKNRSRNGINRAGSPGSLNYLPAYLLRIAANK